MANWVSALVLTVFFTFSSSSLVPLNCCQSTIKGRAHLKKRFTWKPSGQRRRLLWPRMNRHNRQLAAVIDRWQVRHRVRYVGYTNSAVQWCTLLTEWAPKITAPPPSTWRPQWSPIHRNVFNFRPFASSIEANFCIAFLLSLFSPFSLSHFSLSYAKPEKLSCYESITQTSSLKVDHIWLSILSLTHRTSSMTWHNTQPTSFLFFG